MAEQKLSLHRKLAQVMHEAERIPKNGTAPQVMGGYPFVQVGDAADYIRKALAAHLITMMPTNVQVVGQVDRQTARGGTMTTVDLITTWTLTDGESGESIQIQSFGAGADGGDKYSGKASTSAMKYALLTGFLLSTGDDTEGHATPEQRPAHDAPQRPVPTGIVETKEHPAPEPVQTHDGGLIGIAKVGNGKSDFELRQTPAGAGISFRLAQGRQGIKVVALGPLAEAIASLRSTIEDQRVTCFGSISDEEFIKEGKVISYQVLTLTRLVHPDFTLPADEGPPADLPLFGEDAA